MSYMQMAQLDVLNLIKGINTEGDYIDFRNMLAHYFADKAQKQIDALWDNGTINDQVIEAWGQQFASTAKGIEEQMNRGENNEESKETNNSANNKVNNNVSKGS